MGEVWTVTFRASFSSNLSQNAGLCGLFSSQVAVEGFVCWHNTSDASQSWENFWGGVEAVPHFHKEELISRGGGEWRWEISIPCVHLHLHCPVSPKEWPALSLKPSCTQHSRGSSVGVGAASSSFGPLKFVTLSWKATWAANPAWLLCPDLSEQLKAWFTHPHSDKYVLCIPTNLLTVLVVQSLSLFDKQMPGGWI